MPVSNLVTAKPVHAAGLFALTLSLSYKAAPSPPKAFLRAEPDKTKSPIPIRV